MKKFLSNIFRGRAGSPSTPLRLPSPSSPWSRGALTPVFLFLFLSNAAHALTITNAPAEVSATTAVIWAGITNIPGEVSATCYYGTADGATNAAAWAYTAATSATNDGPLSVTVTNLAPATWYYYRWSAAGTDTAWAAASSNFITLARPPENYPTPGRGIAVMADPDTGDVLTPLNLHLPGIDTNLIAQLIQDLDLHIGSTDNPHEVSPTQIGAATQADLGLLDGRVDQVEIDVGAVSGRVNQVETDVGTVSGRVNQVEIDVGAVSGRVNQVETDVGAVSGRVNQVETDVGTVSGRVDQVEIDVGAVSGRVDQVETDVGTVSGRVDQVESDLTSTYQAYTKSYTSGGTNTIVYSDGPLVRIDAANNLLIRFNNADYPTSGVSRVAVELWAGAHSISFDNATITNAVAPVISTDGWTSLFFRRSGNDTKWKGRQ